MRKTLSIILLLAAVTTLSAQSKWSYRLGFGGEMKSGNVNTTIFNNNGAIERNDSTLAFDANYAIVYGMKDKVVFDKSLTANMKFDLWQYDRWSPFVSLTYYNNKFKGYEYKLSFLAGVKYRLFWNEKCDYSLSAAYVYDYVYYFKYNADGLIPESERLKPQVNRLSLRFKARQSISDYVTINHTTFYQPSVTDFAGDYIVSSITSLSTKLTTHMSLNLNFNYEYHSLVPKGVQKQDIITSATLSLKF